MYKSVGYYYYNLSYPKKALKGFKKASFKTRARHIALGHQHFRDQPDLRRKGVRIKLQQLLDMYIGTYIQYAQSTFAGCSIDATCKSHMCILYYIVCNYLKVSI